MKERPIIFSDEMLKAILSERKTMTRRVVKLRTMDKADKIFDCEDGVWQAEVRCKHGTVFESLTCPFGLQGDRLWVVTLMSIPGYEAVYSVGDDGHVYRVDGVSPRRLKPYLSSGYQRVELSKQERRKRFVHELVCSAFYGERPTERHEVRHLDGCRTNNLPENLDWGTPEQNWQDRKAHGRGVLEQHHNAKLNMNVAVAMRDSEKTSWQLAKEYGVSSKTVSNVLTGRTWNRVEQPPANMPRWASRLTLEITSVRVERLQEISEEDAAAEGSSGCFEKHLHYDGREFRCSFERLWDSINATRPGHSWESNPWVWCLSFKRCENEKTL